jgi:4-alpha-glucanotransferase
MSRKRQTGFYDGTPSAKLFYMKKLPEKPLELTRAAGVLCPLSAVPSANRLKKLSEVYGFIDFLASSGQTLWQILPLNPRGKGRSPFCSSSSFALDKSISGKNYKINAAEYDEFCRENAYWLDDHALYKTLKKAFGDRPWQEWPKDEKDRTNLSQLVKKHSGEIEKIKKDQFVCQRLWLDIKKYANERGIKIIGDLPIYMAMDSADVWARRGLFRLNENGSADLHAGVPPDISAVTARTGAIRYTTGRRQSGALSVLGKTSEQSRPAL